MEEKEYFEGLKENRLPVVVDFWAPWCGPCKTIEPLLNKLGQEYAGRVDVWKVNIEESRELKTRLHIAGIPTLIVYREGREVTRCTGAASIKVLSWAFESAISGEAPTQMTFTLHEGLVSLMLGLNRMISRLQSKTKSNSSEQSKA